MSTDDERPLTRAELRAAREAEAEAIPAGRDADPDASPRAVPDETDAPARRSSWVQGPADAEPSRAQKERPPREPRRPAKVRPAKARREEKVPGSRRFRYLVLAVFAVLLLVAAGLGAVSLLQGPRISQVQVDPSEAIESSGSRIILTANQSLSAIDASQVTVDPSVPFTVDAAGRGVGVRFTVPLDDQTEYTVRIAGVTAATGGPSADLVTSFTTPAAEMFLLQRSADDEGDDTIFRTDLTGEHGTPVFEAARIDDYRATATELVVVVEEDDESRIVVTDLDGENARELPLPGDGYVSSLQVSDRGNLVGYLFTDRDLSAAGGRASVLVTQALDRDDDPHIMSVGGAEASILEWQFVPDSAAALFIDFSGTLSLDDLSGDAGPQTMGIASAINGISRGTYTAIIELVDTSVVELDLSTGAETPLEASNPDYGVPTMIVPYPGGTLRHIVQRDDAGLPTGQSVIRVDDAGAATPLLEVAGGSSIIQVCASPSGQYAAIVEAPDLVNNAYDDLRLPLPTDLRTHLIDIRTGEELPVLSGFDSSWCPLAPSF